MRWCNNTLSIHGPVDEVARFRQAAAATPLQDQAAAGVDPDGARPPEVRNFHGVGRAPLGVVVEDVHQGGGGAAAGVTATPLPPDGVCGDREWEVEHWGCLAGAQNSRVERDERGHLVYAFLTPRSAPDPFTERASALFPALTFTLQWSEEGEYAGRSVYRAGELLASEGGDLRERPDTLFLEVVNAWDRAVGVEA